MPSPPPQLDLDWSFQLKNGIPRVTRQSLIPGGSVEVSHENLFGNSESASVSLSASDWRNPSADLGFSFSYSEPFFKPHTTRNLQVRGAGAVWERQREGQDPRVHGAGGPVRGFGLTGWQRCWPCEGHLPSRTAAERLGVTAAAVAAVCCCWHCDFCHHNDTDESLRTLVCYTGPQLFNTRKTSTIFTSGGEGEVPPVFVDRFGVKGWTSKITGQDNKVRPWPRVGHASI